MMRMKSLKKMKMTTSRMYPKVKRVKNMMRFLVKRPIKNLTPKKRTRKTHQYKGKVCSSGSIFSPTQERKHNKTRTRHVNVDSDSTEDDSDEFSEHVSNEDNATPFSRGKNARRQKGPGAKSSFDHTHELEVVFKLMERNECREQLRMYPTTSTFVNTYRPISITCDRSL